jgi:hypothetical protein
MLDTFLLGRVYLAAKATVLLFFAITGSLLLTQFFPEVNPVNFLLAGLCVGYALLLLSLLYTEMSDKSEEGPFRLLFYGSPNAMLWFFNITLVVSSFGQFIGERTLVFSGLWMGIVAFIACTVYRVRLDKSRESINEKLRG